MSFAATKFSNITGNIFSEILFWTDAFGLFWRQLLELKIYQVFFSDIILQNDIYLSYFHALKLFLGVRKISATAFDVRHSNVGFWDDPV